MGTSLIDTLKRTTWNFFTGSQLTFGPGAVGTLASVIHRQKAKRVLVISDSVLLAAGIVAQVETAIKQTSAQVKIFADGEVSPSTATVAKLVEGAREFQPDMFVAVGGGSSMDLAKAAAAVFTNDVDAESIFGFDQVPGATVRLACLPTTAGTGSEVTHSAILKDSLTGEKAAVLSQYVRPEIAIVDPQLTLSCPPNITAESGLHALSHAVEAFLVTNFYAFAEDMQHGLAYEGNHPLGDLYAEKAISLIGTHLQKAVDEPENLAARSSMAFAATLAGAASSSCGVSMTHAFAFAIGSTYKCSHGIGNALALPAVMRFWMPQRQSRLAKIAVLLGVPDAAQMNEEEAAEAGIMAVKQLRQLLSLPTRFADIGGKPDDLDALATTAMSLERVLDLSPRKPTIEDVRRILEDSL